MSAMEEVIRALMGAAKGLGSNLFAEDQKRQGQLAPANGSPQMSVGSGGIPEMQSPQQDAPQTEQAPQAPFVPKQFSIDPTGDPWGAQDTPQGGGGASSNVSAPSSSDTPSSDKLEDITDEDLAKLIKMMGLKFETPEGTPKIPLHPEYAKYNVGKNAHPALTAEQQAMGPGDIVAQQAKQHQDWLASINADGDWKPAMAPLLNDRY